MAGRKATKAEVRRRVARIYELLLAGATRDQILRYVADPPDGLPWGVSERMVDYYIARARVMLEEQAAVRREEMFGLAVARLNDLFRRALARNQLDVARRCQKDLSELLGLEAPRRHEVSGPDGAPLIADLAAQVEAIIDRQARALADDGGRD